VTTYAHLRVSTDDLSALRDALASDDTAAIRTAAAAVAASDERVVTMFHSDWGASYRAVADKPVRLFRPWKNLAGEIVIPVNLGWLRTLTTTELRGSPAEVERFIELLRSAIDGDPVHDPQLP
jgi:sugar phosphate isomerase/epimerase